jgi:regulator of protease activity HflC (stomatin/prohibitin superfamily)
MFYKTVKIAAYELGLLFRDTKFERFMEPGEHKLALYGKRRYASVLDLRKLPVTDAALDMVRLTRPGVLDEHFGIADLGDTEVAFVLADGKLVDVVGPAKVAFYGKRLYDLAIEVIDAAAVVEVPAAMVAPVARLKARDLVVPGQVPSDHVGLLYVDGVLDRRLAPGSYAFLKAVRDIHVAILDTRLTTLEVTGQELLTKDRIAVRANVTAVYRIADPEAAVSVTADVGDYLYKALQFALREVIGTRTLEAVLGDKAGINEAIAERLTPKLADAGLEVPTAGVKDIILPGDIRALMNRVIEAEKTAQANVIKRREETAATRSLLNTAKLMEDNPTLLRLKELEALEKVSEKVGNVIVGNGMNGVLTDLVRIKPKPAREAE